MPEKCVYEYIDEKDNSKRCNFKPDSDNLCNQANSEECYIIIGLKEYASSFVKRPSNCSNIEGLAVGEH